MSYDLLLLRIVRHFFMKIKLFFLISIVFIVSSCSDKSFAYRIPNFRDQYYFDNVKINKPKYSDNFLKSADSSFDDDLDLDIFLENNKTLSFIIIRNDSILYEKYFYDTLQHPTTPTFSISKSFVSSLLGIAIEDGYIKSIKEPITNYIPELYDFKDITIEMLLNMCSGLDSDGFMKVANIYFSTDLRKIVNEYQISKTPGREYSYQNVNTLLLCMVIERAVGVNIVNFFEKELWQKAGMSHDATWSVDSKSNNQVKGFCGINAAPIDLARFGCIYLYNGFYNGNQIVPEEWVKESFTKYNKFKDEDGYYYSYGWRITDSDAYVAVGFMGQYVYVNQDKNIVVVRTGQSYDSFNWIDFIDKLTEQL